MEMDKISGAENGTRTRDLRVGNATLYQLSYSRKEVRKNLTKSLQSLKAFYPAVNAQ